MISLKNRICIYPKGQDLYVKSEGLKRKVCHKKTAEPSGSADKIHISCAEGTLNLIRPGEF